MGFLLAQDAISGKEGKIIATIGGKVVELAEVKNIKATIEKTKTPFKALGHRGEQTKASGWKGTGSMEIYYVTSRFSKMLIDYANTGKDLYFSMLVTNDDPGSSIGEQTIALYQCNLDGGDILSLDVDAEFLSVPHNFTFSGVQMITEFKPYTIG